MVTIPISEIARCCASPLTAAVQVIVDGTSEDKMFQQIVADVNADARRQRLVDFEKRFPHSKVLPNAYFMLIDIYRQKGDRSKVIEYGEKILKTDKRNVAAMMVLSLNYSRERKDLDRAVALAEETIVEIGRMKAQRVPAQYNDALWKRYLQTMEGTARSMLEYAKAVRKR